MAAKVSLAYQCKLADVRLIPQTPCVGCENAGMTTGSLDTLVYKRILNAAGILIALQLSLSCQTSYGGH